jgi:predicted dehydrogenase
MIPSICEQMQTEVRGGENLEKLRFAVIGLGKMGLLHASLLNTFEGVELVALCDKSALMTRFCRSIFSSTQKVVVNDLVYVTTPISSHAFIVKDVYARGIAQNIFTEKTLASNYTQAKEMCECARKIGGKTMVGFMKRFSVVFGKAKELLAQDNLGEPRSFSAYAYSSDFLGITKDSKSSASRGGALRDIGCHILDLMLWLLGDLEVDDVVSSHEIGGAETSVSFTVANPNGLEGRFDISQRMPGYRMPEFGCLLKCSRGKIDVNDDRLLLTSRDGSQETWYRHDLNDNVSFFLGETEYYREDQEFVNSLLANRMCEPSFETASKVDCIIDQVGTRIAKRE